MIQKIKMFFSTIFKSRTKRIEAALKIFKALENAVDGSGDEALVAMISVINGVAGKIVGGIFDFLEKAMPILIDMLELMEVSSKETSYDAQIQAISKKLKEQTGKEVAVLQVISEVMADEKLTLAEAYAILKEAEEKNETNS